MEMKDRIKKLRKELDLTQQEFSKKIGSSQNIVANYEIGRRNPSASVMNNICKTFDVNENWLRTGEGEMFEEATDKEKLMRYTGLLLKDTDSVIAAAIQSLIITYEQLDSAGKATLEKIALQYLDNFKKSQREDAGSKEDQSFK